MGGAYAVLPSPDVCPQNFTKPPGIQAHYERAAGRLFCYSYPPPGVEIHIVESLAAVPFEAWLPDVIVNIR